MEKIFKNYVFNLIYEVLAMIAPLLTAPYLARVLGADGTGIYSYVHSTVALMTSLIMLGVFSYGCRQIAYVRDDKEKLSEVFWGIMTARLVILAVGTIVYIVICLANMAYLLYFIAYYTYFIGYCLDCTWLFVGVEDMKWAVLKNALMKILAVMGIFVLVRTREDAIVYILVQGCSILFANLLAYSQINSYVGKARLVFCNLKKDLVESAKLYLPSVAATIYLQCDKIMLENITGLTSQVSFYDYAEKIVMIPLSFIKCLSTVMMPRIANEYYNNNTSIISELLNKAAKLSMYMAFPLMFGIIAVSSKLVPWYLGNEFLPVSTAIIFISPLIVSNTLTGISGGQYFTATNQIGILLKSQILAAIGNIVLNLILIPKYGFVGAAIATLVSSFINAIIQYWHLTKQVKLPGLGLCMIKYCIMSSIMLVVISITSKGMNANVVTTCVQILVGSAFYFILCFVLKDEQNRYLFTKLKTIVGGRNGR